MSHFRVSTRSREREIHSLSAHSEPSALVVVSCADSSDSSMISSAIASTCISRARMYCASRIGSSIANLRKLDSAKPKSRAQARRVSPLLIRSRTVANNSLVTGVATRRTLLARRLARIQNGAGQDGVVAVNVGLRVFHVWRRRQISVGLQGFPRSLKHGPVNTLELRALLQDPLLGCWRSPICLVGFLYLTGC